MTQAFVLIHPDQRRLQDLDDSSAEIDLARERAGIVLYRSSYNVISMAVRDQLHAVFEALDADDRVCVTIVRALGTCFSSGGDIKGFLEVSPEHVPKLAWNVAAPARCNKPIIVANQGYCFGVGSELSLARDFRIATHTIEYALPERKLGQIPGSGGLAQLQEMVGVSRTKDIVMRSRRIPGLQAYNWGIVVDCVTDSNLTAATDALAGELRVFLPLTQRAAKKLLSDIGDAPLPIAIELEEYYYSRPRSSDDFHEGVEAFHGKYKPVFRSS